MSKEQIDRIVIHTDTVVKGFFGDYRWLSNFHLCEVHYEGLVYTSSEGAYQSAKTTDSWLREAFTKEEPSKTKKMGQELRIRSGWDRMKVQVMYDVLKDKFTRNEDLKIKLLETGSKYLEETNYWDDTFWGVYEGKGKNVLGELLMKVRNELKLQESWIEKL
jgi:ribA/ribD-fused uncharacterized protein